MNSSTTQKLSYDKICPICERLTKKLGPIYELTPKARVNWVSDSTFELIGEPSLNVSVQFCRNCWHGFILPRFDSSCLYGDRGVEVRKRHYSLYFPNIPYTSRATIQLKSAALYGMAKIESKRFKHIFEAFEKCGANYLSSDHQILDWGGGDGYLGQSIRELLRGVSDLNVQSRVFDLVDWEKNNESTGKDGITSGSQDLIIVSHMLEHVHDPISEILKVKPYLKQNGLLFVEVPYEQLSLIKVLLGKKAGLNYHVSLFSTASLRRAVEQAGFEIKYSRLIHRSSYRGRQLSSIIVVATPARESLKRLKMHALKPLTDLLVALVGRILGRFIPS